MIVHSSHWLAKLCLRIPLSWNVIRMERVREGHSLDYTLIRLGGY